MSSAIPTLKLFPLYPGGPVLQANRGSLNGDSQFYTQSNRFTPAYGVNLSTGLNRDTANLSYTIRGYQAVSDKNSGASVLFNTPLQFQGKTPGKLARASTSGTPPSIPSVYDDLQKLLTISELNFSQLMAQPSFIIPTIGMGLKITTDGLGGVAKQEISPSSRGSIPKLSVISDDFGAANRAEITIGATKKVGPGVGLGETLFDTTPTVKAKPLPQDNNALLSPINTLKGNNGIFKLDRQAQLALDALTERENNLGELSILDRLHQLQPQEGGLGLSGYNAQLDAEQSRQLAATQAKFNVLPNERFRENVASLTSAYIRQPESYAAALNPANNRMDQLMNGKINIPSSALTDAGAQKGSATSGGSAFEMGNSVSDAMSRKGKGASYVPFRQTAQGQSGHAFGNANPFMGSNTGMNSGASGNGPAFGGGHQQSASRQFRPPRQPITLMA